MERDIVSRKFDLNTSFIRDYDESQKKDLVPRFLIQCLATNEKADILFFSAENKIRQFFNYLHIASSLYVSDRLQTFWKYVLLYLTLPIAKSWPGKPFIFRHLQNAISTWKINQNFMSFCLMQAHLTQPTS